MNSAPSNNKGDLSKVLTSKPKRKRGRPKGSKTQDIPSVPCLVVPPQCPGCGNHELMVIATTVTRQISGEIRGWRYNSVKWRRCRCTTCGQTVSVRTYEMDELI